MNIRRLVTKKSLLVLSIVTVMVWQFGQAGYILAKAQLAQYLMQAAWDKTLKGERKVKPWSWADTWPVARLKVPKHNIDLIVLAGDSGRTLAFGPGYRFGSAVLNKSGIAMISGHRDTHFSFLAKVKTGDRLNLQSQTGQNIRYEIVSTKIVHSKKAQIPVITQGPQLTLVTCYPFNALRSGGSLRYVVSARQVSQ